MKRALLACTLLVVGCGSDSTGPTPPLHLTITGDASQVGTAQPNGTRECALHLISEATGGGKSGYALWQSGDVTWFDYPEMSYKGTIHMDAGEMADFWGSDRVPSGGSVTNQTTWYNPLGVPFRMEMIFRYQVYPTGEQRSLRHYFTCT